MIEPSWSRKLSYQCLIFYNMEDLQNLYKLYQDKYIVYTQVRIYILTLASLSRTYLIRTILWWYIPHIMIYKIEKKNPRWKTNMCVTILSGIIQCLHLFLTATSIMYWIFLTNSPIIIWSAREINPNTRNSINIFVTYTLDGSIVCFTSIWCCYYSLFLIRY